MKKCLHMLLVLSFLFGSVSFASAELVNTGIKLTRTLMIGAKGDDVKSLQQILIDKGFLTGKADGSFGPKTRLALINFQRANNLGVDGKAGPKVRDFLAKTIVVADPPSPKTCLPTDEPRIQVVSPNGGEIWKIGQTYSVSWSTCNIPTDSWVKFTYSIPPGVGNIHYNQECFGGGQVPASQGYYSWTISPGVFGCSDAGYIFPSDTSFLTKVKAELYTGTPVCQGLPTPNSPCMTGTRTLHAQDESDANLTITNKSEKTSDNITVGLQKVYSLGKDGLMKDGLIAECVKNGNIYYTTQPNGYDVGGQTFDSNGNSVGYGNWATSTGIYIDPGAEICERIYVVYPNIWGYQAVNKYNLH